jgi:hypothetical protein
MTSFASLFACPAAEVTFERVRNLVGERPSESLTLEFKEKYSPGVPKSVAAMANSYGGMILIGVTDNASDATRLVGVSVDAITQVANGCHEQLEPPWQPEIIEVPLPAADGLFVLVIRVDPARAPRPLMLDGKVPVRLAGRNATADRGRVAQLFTEAAPAVRTAGYRLPAPVLPLEPDGSSTVDFALRSGLWVPVGEATTWRPLSERAVDALAVALNSSALAARLLKWSGDFGAGGMNPFHRLGLNRSRRVRLVWQAVVDSAVRNPVEAIVQLELPDATESPATAMQVTVDVQLRARALLAAAHPSARAEPWRLSVPDLYETVDALIQGLIDPSVIAALAGLAGVEPELVPQPSTLHFIAGVPVGDLVLPYKLTPIPDAGTSLGANLRADPARDLADDDERREQVDNWLLQIALDAGLRGMEDLLREYHATRSNK